MANDFFSVEEIESTQFKVMEFIGKWLESFGRPEARGVWIIYGESFHGKSTFMMQLARYLTEFVKNKVLINSLEEGKSESLKLNIKRAELSTVAKKILLGNKVPMERVLSRVDAQRSPEIIINDSIQYTDLNRKTYDRLRKDYNSKLWIFISQADGKIPRGALAKHVRFDADVKIRVEGYKAFVESRYGGGAEFIIDPERAAKYWGKIA
ncbi:hypothetical protein [Chryseobacterium scophthalmum]|uniref:hypothetical protein n=1 Tax=Chryseobacterium scophthalmum TaxID=59733 RepID=UPI0011AF5527|nr:hypothetical protein [Chryseobacterium scophthalmum]